MNSDCGKSYQRHNQGGVTESGYRTGTGESLLTRTPGKGVLRTWDLNKNLRLGGGVSHRRSGREGFPGRGDCTWKCLDLERACYVQGAGRRQTAEFSEWGARGGGRRIVQTWVKILTRYGKPAAVDDNQKNDLNYILKGALRLQLQAWVSLYPSFFWEHHRKELQRAQLHLSLTGKTSVKAWSQISHCGMSFGGGDSL